MAVECGADGVWLINGPAQALKNLAAEIAPTVPFVGVNCLGQQPHHVVDSLPGQVKGIWSDDAGIHTGGLTKPETFSQSRRGWDGLYFGGVAFKGRPLVKTTPAAAAKAAIPWVDVITTSGRGTGYAADISKIRDMRAAIGDHPMGLASGVTPDNVSIYLPYVDYFLVATGIEKADGVFDPDKTRRLADAIHNY
ncbi:MAG: hypothetical protein ACYCW6_27795 [Candidatus Xenobia bacterium]